MFCSMCPPPTPNSITLCCAILKEMESPGNSKATLHQFEMRDLFSSCYQKVNLSLYLMAHHGILSTVLSSLQGFTEHFPDPTYRTAHVMFLYNVTGSVVLLSGQRRHC